MYRTKEIFRIVLVICLAFLAGNTYGLNPKQVKVKDKKLNVLLIYTDDHRFSGVHTLAGQQVKTPNIDKLAESGVVFNNTYLNGAFTGATCLASRAQLLSGRSVFQLEKQGAVVPADQITIAENFKNNAYHSHVIGKWHQDNESLTRSFTSGDKLMSGNLGAYLCDHWRMPMWDFQKDGVYGFEKGYLICYDKNGKEFKRSITSADKNGPFGSESDGPHSSEVFGRAAAEFIANYSEENPFFMYLAFHAPHDPRQAPQKYQDMYPFEDIQLTPSYMREHPFDNGDLFLRDEQLAPWPRTKEVAQKHLAAYYAIISHMDEQVGKVIKALKESGMYENTLIVFSGDSGLGVGNHGLMGKQNLYNEDGIHVPLIFAGGPIKSHSESEALCYIHDIYPTICDIAGVDIPSSVSGISLYPVLKGEKQNIRESLFFAYRQYQRAYIKGDYKLIEYVKALDESTKELKGSRVTQLFNIKTDFWEIHNLASHLNYQEKVKEMRAEIREAAKDNGDTPENAGAEIDFWDYMER